MAGNKCAGSAGHSWAGGGTADPAAVWPGRRNGARAAANGRPCGLSFCRFFVLQFIGFVVFGICFFEFAVYRRCVFEILWFCGFPAVLLQRFRFAGLTERTSGCGKGPSARGAARFVFLRWAVRFFRQNERLPGENEARALRARRTVGFRRRWRRGRCFCLRDPQRLLNLPCGGAAPPAAGPLCHVGAFPLRVGRRKTARRSRGIPFAGGGSGGGGRRRTGRGREKDAGISRRSRGKTPKGCS